jgi:hypothetical protein
VGCFSQPTSHQINSCTKGYVCKRGRKFASSPRCARHQVNSGDAGPLRMPLDASTRWHPVGFFPTGFHGTANRQRRSESLKLTPSSSGLGPDTQTWTTAIMTHHSSKICSIRCLLGIDLVTHFDVVSAQQQLRLALAAFFSALSHSAGRT